jgi:hypothetical protein
MVKSINKWVFVATGVIFNIAAAVITHYFIGINDQHLNQLEKRSMEQDTLIQSQWRMKTEIDRKQEFLLTLLNQNKIQPQAETTRFIVQQINLLLAQQKLNTQQIKPDEPIDFGTITEASKLIQNQIISRINNTYLEKLEIEDRKAPLKERNSTLYSVAIFLQLMGLILVLAKDLGK